METIIVVVMGLLTIASYLVGFLLPRIIKIATQNIAGDDERVVITYIVCFLAAMLIDWKSLNAGDVQHVGQWFAFIATQAHVSYKLYFKPKWEEVAVNQ